MKTESWELVKQMDALAVKSLPPDVYEIWRREIYGNYSLIVFTDGFSDTDDISNPDSWELNPLPAENIKICCDICDAEGLNACRGSKGDDDEPAEEDTTEFDLDWQD